jgi:1-acyl-sn-glycerol-3-phosphate acyltransferase
MNHQSVLDVMILLSELRGPGVLIPVRTRYLRGIPGISPFLRMARYPSIGQKRATVARDVAAIAEGAESVAAGTATIAVFPEGHRTRSGAIGPFMPTGLRTLVARSGRPVYCFVGDGMWQVRTIADAMTSLAGTSVDVRVLGPFVPPADERDVPRFIETLRETMVQTLAQIRAHREPDSLEVRVVD